MANIYIIAGANGAGKTTTSLEILPEFLQIIEYVNADEIARGISPLNYESVAIQAGRLMLKRLNFLKENQLDFAFETTLSSRHYARFIKQCQQQGYTVNLFFFWLNSPELAVTRVLQRVQAGGHNIPKDIIYRRYYRGLKNLFSTYLSLCNNWFVYDNSNFPTSLISQYTRNENLTIYNQQKWQKMQEDRNG